MLRRYVSVVVASPKVVIALVGLITVVLGFFISRLKVNIDVDAQIPPGHPLVIVGKRIEKEFGGKYMTVIGVYPKEGTVYTPAIIGKVKRITDAIEKIPGVKEGSIISLTSKRMKDINSTEDALEVKQLAEKVPQNDAEMAEFRKRVDRNKVLTSLLVSDDGRATAILADFDDFVKAGGPKGLYPTLEKILEPEREANVEVLSAGAPSVLYWLLQYTRRVAVLFLVALAMIGYLHYRAFRTLQGMIVPLVTAIMGVIWALGLMGLIQAPMDPWNIMTPILLLAIGAGHSVQILKRFYEEFAREKREHPELSDKQKNTNAVVEATVKVGAVMLAAGAIAALSFGSLAAFGLPSIKSFGLCTAFGITAALIVEMTFIPSVRILMSPPTAEQAEREQHKEIFDTILERLADVVRAKKEGPILWVFIALLAVAGVGVFKLQAGNSLGAQFFEANGPVHGFRMADSRMAGTRVIQVLIEGNATDTIKDPKVLAKMDELSKFIAHQPLPIGKVVSIVDVLKQIQKAIDPEHPDLFPDTPELVAQQLLLYSMSGDDDDLSRLVDRDFRNAVITAYVKTDDFRSMKSFTVAVQDAAARLFQGLPVKATVGGGVTNAIALNETMVHGKTINLIQISILVMVITSVLLRSITGGFLVLLPLATAALVNLGLMGLSGIFLSMGTAAISAMAVGIGADYAVYFLFRVREEFDKKGDLREATAAALLTSGKAITYVASAVAGGYLCLTFSLFKVHVLLGCLVALTMVTSSAATVAFLPAVLLRVNPKFLRKADAPVPAAAE
ncbi:MAG TPA: MMPL family transporter [Polyangiaceae bacterium]|nr:MMPL family transporter [Polyangiaceae bacterium]